MNHSFERLIGDDVILKSTGDKAEITQRKLEFIDTGAQTRYTEFYYIKYKDKPHAQGTWIKSEYIKSDKVDDELKYPEQVYYVIIDTFLMKDHINFDMVKYYNDERNNLK